MRLCVDHIINAQRLKIPQDFTLEGIDHIFISLLRVHDSFPYKKVEIKCFDRQYRQWLISAFYRRIFSVTLLASKRATCPEHLSLCTLIFLIVGASLYKSYNQCT